MATDRPAVLNDVSETQLEELDRQYGEGDQTYWRELTTGYGWSDEDSQAVWDWFAARPVAGHAAPVGGAWTSEANAPDDRDEAGDDMVGDGNGGGEA